MSETTHRRVKVTGDLFHGHVPEGAVYVGRAAPGLKASRFGNPWSVRDYGREGAVGHFREWLTARRKGRPPSWFMPLYAEDVYDFAALKYPSDEEIRAELAGRDLACWCKPGDACHADVLLEEAGR